MGLIFVGFLFLLVGLLYPAPVGSSFPITTQTGDQQNPSVIYLPNYRLYFVVWEDWSEITDSDIYGAFFDENGNLCGSEFRIAGTDTDTNYQVTPDVAYAPDLNKILVVWKDNNPNYVKFKEVNLTGFDPTNCTGYALGTTNDIGFNRIAGENLVDRIKPKVAYNVRDHEFIVVWREVRSEDKVLRDNCLTTSFNLLVDDNTFVGYARINANTLGVTSDIIRDPKDDDHARLIRHSAGALQEIFEYEIFNKVSNVDVDCLPTGECLIVFEADRNRVNVQCTCIDTNDNGICDNTETTEVSSSVDNFSGDDDNNHIFVTTLTQFQTSTGLLPRVDSSSEQSTNPRIKADPVSGRFLVVWEDRRDNPQKTKIYSQIITHEGNLYGGNFVISFKDEDGDGNNDLLNVKTANPAVGYDGANNLFFVVWEDERDGTSQQNLNIYGQYVTPEGALQGENYQITTDINNQKFPEVAYNPNQLRFLVVWKDFRNASSSGSDIYGRFFDSIVNQNILILKEDKQTVLYPLIIDFGVIAVNNSDVRTIYIKNNGSNSVDLDCITLTGSGFSIDTALPPQLNNCNDNSLYQLNGGESLELRIRFSPSAENFYEGYIEIKDNLGNVLRKIKLKGEGENNPTPSIEVIESDGVNDGTLNFGDVKSGTVKVESVIIKNTGNVTLTVNAYTDTSEFGIEPIGKLISFNLNPSEQVVLKVIFDATSLKGGTYEGKMYITETSTSATMKTINLKATVIVPANLAITDLQGNPISSLDFGSVKVGSTVQRTIVIKNTSNVPLNVKVTSYDKKFKVGRYDPRTGGIIFSVSQLFTLQPGESQQIVIQFDSANLLGEPILSRGDYTATLFVTTKEGDFRTSIDLKVTLTAPILRVDTDILDFGEVDVGNSKTLSLKIYNDGDANMNITSCGTPPKGFAITQCPTSVAPGGSEELKITFNPQEPGDYTGTIKFETDAGTKEISLKGKGKGAKIELSSNFLDFGLISVGDSKTMVIEVKNTGTEELIINSIDTTNLPDEIKLISVNLPTSIAPGTSLTLTLKFSPSIDQVYRGYFTINSNAFNNPSLDVYVQGIGVPLNVTIEPGVVDFGTVNVGEEKLHGILITNTSEKEIQIIKVSLASDNFVVDIPDLPYTLKPGQSVNIPVTFRPKKEGTFTVNLSILFNFSAQPYIVTLKGSSQVREAKALQFYQNDTSVNVLFFGSVPVKEVKTVTLTIKNFGQSDVNIVRIITKPPFSTLQDHVTIPANSTANINVSFSPLSPGNYNGILQLTDSEGNVYEVGLMGYGTSGKVIVQQGNVSFSEEKVGIPNAVAALKFAITNIPTNTDTVTVRIKFSVPLPEDKKVYKYLGPNDYKEIYPNNTCDGISDVQFSGNTLTFKIKDNSECDLDTTLGRIIDPIVVTKGTPSTSAPVQSLPSLKGSGGGGCSTTENTDYSFLLTVLLLILLRVKHKFSFLL